MQRARILIASEDFPAPSVGGLGKHALLLARVLSQQGYHVDFLGNSIFDFDQYGSELEISGKFIAAFNGHQKGWKEGALGFFNPLKRWHIARQFSNIINNLASDYDVIHYHGHVADAAFFLDNKINFIQTRHDQGADCFRHTRFKGGDICTEVNPVSCASCIAKQAKPARFQQTLTRLAVEQFRSRVLLGMKKHKTIFVSDCIRQNLSRNSGVPATELGVVIHNFVDSKKLNEISTSERPRAENKFLVFIAGKIYQPKGILQFIEQLIPVMPGDMEVEIAGDGDISSVQPLLKGHSISFLGWQDYQSTIALAKRADAIVVPSICEEACATTIHEGLALGKPVYALRRGGTPELAQYAIWPNQLVLVDTLQEMVMALIKMDRRHELASEAHYLGDMGKVL